MKCRLGPKKLKLVQDILGPTLRLKTAFVRGGWDHGMAQCLVYDEALRPDENAHRKVIYVNYRTRIIEPWDPDSGLRGWSESLFP